MDQTSLDALAGSGGLKLLLNRQRRGPATSWLQVGYGAEAPKQPKTHLKVALDYNGGLPPEGQHDTQFTPVGDEWFEIETHYLRAGGTGRARMWINGKLVIDVTDPNFGTDATTDDMSWTFALDYVQNSPAGVTIKVYVDDAQAANGFIDPADSMS